MKKNQNNQSSAINSIQQNQGNSSHSKNRQSANGGKKTVQNNANLLNQNNTNFSNNTGQEEKKRPQTNADKYKQNTSQNPNSIQRQTIQTSSGLRDKKQIDMNYDQAYNLEDLEDKDAAYDSTNQKGQNKKIEKSDDQENIVKLISEYLIKHGCQRSNEVFIKEIQRTKTPQSTKQVIENTLLTLEFYLQIYFLIYEIHPLFKTKEKIGNERIEYFRQYLDSKGSELSKTTELLSFYALPYIQKPQEHQNFKQLFTTEWVQDLQKKLKQTLEKLVHQDEQNTLLELLYNDYKERSKHIQGIQPQQIQHGQLIGNLFGQQYPAPYLPLQQQQINSQNINSYAPTPINNVNISYQYNDLSYLPDNSYINDNNSLRANNDQYLRVLQELNSRYSNLHKVYIQVQEQAKQAIMDSHQKWFKLGQDLVALSKELITMVDQAVKGKSPQPQIFESKKKKLGQFEHFLTSNIEDLVQQSQDISLFEKQVSVIEYDQSPIIQQFKVQQQPSFNLPILGSNIQYDQQQLQIQKQNINKDNDIINNPFNSDYKNNNQLQIEQMGQISEINQQDPQQYNQADTHSNFQSYAPIDFSKIKTALKKQDKNFQFKISILQALRWRIAKTKNAYQRREVIISYTLNDILGCQKYDVQLQNAIFNSSNNSLTEFGLRLVNALASDFEGRTYLVESESLVKLLIQILRRELEDSCTRRNALGALQKLSLRKKPQIVMIQNDLIRWIVETLRNEKDQLSEYSYEYATALLMNLSLRSLGRDKCEDEDLYVLEVLQQLLEHENHQVRTFVNGTLYSLLSRPVLKEQSRQLSLLQHLVYLRDNSDERFNKQLQYIINQLEKSDEEEEDENMSDQEEDNDEDDIEDEDMDEDEDEQDEYFYLQEIPGDDKQQLIGENLLIQQFNLRGQEALRQHNMTRTALEECKKNAQNSSILSQSKINNRPEPFNRPATPSLSISQISHSQIQGQSDTRRGKQQNNVIQQLDSKNNKQQYPKATYQNQQNINEKEIQMQNQQQLVNKEQKQQIQTQQKQHPIQQQQYQQQQQTNKQNSGQKQNYQMQNEYGDYYSNSPEGKNLNMNQQYKQQQSYNQQSQINQQNQHLSQQNNQVAQKYVKPPPQEIKTDTKEAFAPRPKIPRTPPNEEDEQ